MLMETTAQSLTEQLLTRFAARIRNRLVAPGARLCSGRQCASQPNVSPSTVVEARKNRGCSVRELASAPRKITI